MKTRRIQSQAPNALGPFWGHTELRARLEHSLTSGSLPPVILFSGPAGIGKSSAARWLVQRDWCRQSNRPCLRCSECRATTHGQHADMTVLHGENHEPISIETIRQAFKGFRHRPTVADRSRWLIIENAEWLSLPAVSALLKFLEEPPPLSQVILTTAHPDLIPRTIRSRASLYRWHLIPSEMWPEAHATRAALARAAGRPGWLQIDHEQEQVAVDETLAVLSGQPLPAAWIKREADQSRELLQTIELVVRDVMLVQAHSEKRLLWPDKLDSYKQIPAHSNLLSLLDRLGARSRQLRHHVAPRLLIQDLLPYV